MFSNHKSAPGSYECAGERATRTSFPGHRIVRDEGFELRLHTCVAVEGLRVRLLLEFLSRFALTILDVLAIECARFVRLCGDDDVAAA